MIEIRYLDNSIALQYSELIRHCIHPVSDGSNLSFKAKRINGKKYWYLYISLGPKRIEHYLGPESTELLDRIEDEKALWQSKEDDKALRARLVAMLVAGGAKPTPREEGKVLALLERSGVFLVGGLLVGTLAFRAYANMLGVVWHSDLQTQDIDVAEDYLTVALQRQKTPLNLGQVLLDSDMGFFRVPALDRKAPSTSFSIHGRELSVDVVTPMRGRETSRPVEIPNFKTFASPLRFLDYLLVDPQPAVLLYKHGVLINVPSPGRFAIHKCVVSQRRSVAQAEKIRRDLSQAEQVFQALLDTRPGDLQLATQAAADMPDKFMAQFRSGLKKLDDDVVAGVSAAMS